MDLEPLNDRELLADTPIGDLVVVSWWGSPAVAIADPHGERPPRVIHDLDASGVLGALYGKAFWAGPAVQALYDRQKERREDAHERESDAQRSDFRRQLGKYVARHDDAPAELNRLFGRRPRG